MKFYVATQKQENARPVRDALVKLGHTCTATWLDLPDYPINLDNDLAHNLARAKAAAKCHIEVRDADVLILVAEPDKTNVRGGKHVETGMALALGKPVYVLGHRENVFHSHLMVTVCATLDELVANFERPL